MKNKLMISTALFMGLFSATSQAAVSLSQNNQGDLVILPYYSVKNNLNTTFTVNNHSDSLGKLILVAYKESKNNQDALYYNVFLKPNSSWAVGIGAVSSNIHNHSGEPSAVQVFNSNQCAPFLSPQQQFLPYAYEELEESSLSLERVQEGHVEIYEIASYNPNNSEMNNCASLTASITANESFLNQHLSAPTGEISVTASLLNVEEGTSYSYNGVALNGFKDNAVFSFDEYPYYYDFNDASQTATIIQNGMAQDTTWNSGAESINALISSHSIMADFSTEPGNNAQTEMVIGFPGKTFLTSGAQAVAPFTNTYGSDSGSCEEARFSAYSRDGESASSVAQINLCWASNVIKLHAATPSSLPEVLMSQHQLDITPSYITGKIKLSFEHTMQSANGIEVTGLPVLGFSVQRYTNANAAPGLMAQYGSLFSFTTKTHTSSL